MQRLDLFAKRVVTARTRKGISARQVALAIGISPAYMSVLEAARAVPSEEIIKGLCRVLDLDFDATMAKHGRVPSDVQRFICRTPNALAQIRRQMRRSGVASAA